MGNDHIVRVRKRSQLYYIRSVARQVWKHPSNDGRRIRGLVRAFAWQLWKRLSGQPWMVSFGPYRFRCYHDTGSGANVIYFTERFDPIEFCFLERYLRAGDFTVDVGANIGLYSLWIAQFVGHTGRVDAFEASPYHAKRFRENMELNGLQDLVIVHEAAVAAESGMLDFSIDLDVSNGIVAHGSRSISRQATSVRAVRLDGELAESTYSVGKIDVEGAERLVLEGWVGGLASGNPPVLIVEILAHQLRKFGSSPADLLRYADDLGYELFEFDPERNDLVPVHNEPYGTYLLVYREALGEVRARLETGVDRPSQ